MTDFKEPYPVTVTVEVKRGSWLCNSPYACDVCYIALYFVRPRLTASEFDTQGTGTDRNGILSRQRSVYPYALLAQSSKTSAHLLEHSLLVTSPTYS